MNLAGRRIHFVGAGGVGVSALAEFALRRGARVTASDLKENEGTARLRTLGADVRPPGHRAENVAGADTVVHTSACGPDHPEVVAARAAGARVVRRAEFLAECVADRRVLAVAGAHGKTTTTAMAGAILAAAGLDPLVVVGGYLREGGSNLRDGEGPWAVVEADEYDRSFLALTPREAVVNNLDREHLDVYGDMAAVRDAFVAFASRVGSEGRAHLGVDDPEARALAGRLAVPVATYGLSRDADLRAEAVRTSAAGTEMRLVRGGAALGDVALRVPGLHNVRNALGAASAALAVGVPFAAVAAGLGGFRGVARRFEVLGEGGGVVVVDDYAHHPNEVAATLAAARLAEPTRRLVVLFQPHLYSRTRALATEFAAALAAADVAILAPVYGAREAPEPGTTSALITEAAPLAGRGPVLCATAKDVEEALDTALLPGDLLVVMGAGDVRRFGERTLRVRRA